MFCWPGLAWNGGAACWYKIFNLKVSETASQQLDSIPFIAVHNPLTTLQLLCTKQLSWKIYMSSLNQDDIVKTTVHQLTCRFDKTEPTVSYYSMPTTMIWLSQSESGCCCSPKRLNKFLCWHWLFTFVQLRVQNNLWGCICKIFNFISHRCWFSCSLNFTR